MSVLEYSVASGGKRTETVYEYYAVDAMDITEYGSLRETGVSCSSSDANFHQYEVCGDFNARKGALYDKCHSITSYGGALVVFVVLLSSGLVPPVVVIDQ